MRLAAVVLSALALGVAGSAAATCPTGPFRAAAGPDTASGLDIGRDGRFRYFLSEGAVDERAEGRWTCEQGRLLLTTEPTSRPAEYRLERVSRGHEAPFSLRLTWPDGDGIPTVDFRIAFDEGEPLYGYTRADG